MQLILVIIVFLLSAGFLLRKLIWKPFLKKIDTAKDGKHGKLPECGSCDYH